MYMSKIESSLGSTGRIWMSYGYILRDYLGYEQCVSNLKELHEVFSDSFDN